MSAEVGEGLGTPGGGEASEELVVHKPARECFMSEPHQPGICGLVRARRLAQEQADAERKAAIE